MYFEFTVTHTVLQSCMKLFKLFVSVTNGCFSFKN